ncbi:MAG TPA: DUF3237 domain-containing protein [Thermoleophilaceae bacterium]|nr:DUF3237 domain-containing protein [Thermoleophilaceae bacterium]
MDLEHEFTFTARIKEPVSVGAGPFGDRSIFEVVGGEVTGDRIHGTVGSGGGDWALIGDDGFARLDARMTVDTDDGAHVYVEFRGVLELNEAAGAAMAGERPSDYPDHYVRIAPRLETGDSRYAWVNQSLFVGEGRIQPGPAVEYRVYRVA